MPIVAVQYAADCAECTKIETRVCIAGRRCVLRSRGGGAGGAARPADGGHRAAARRVHGALAEGALTGPPHGMSIVSRRLLDSPGFGSQVLGGV